MKNIVLAKIKTGERHEVKNVIEIRVEKHKDAVANGYKKNDYFITCVMDDPYEGLITATFPAKNYVVCL